VIEKQSVKAFPIKPNPREKGAGKEGRREMKLSPRKSLVLGLGLCLLFVAVGCAPITRTVHPQFEMRAKDINTTGFLSPDIKIYEFTAGGMRELRDDWCATGKENVQSAVMECLREKPFAIKPITIDKDLEEELADIYALYRAVSTSINTHTRPGDHQFPEKVKNFDYSIGSVEKILRRYEVDALLFVYGYDEISTAGRKVLKVVGIIASTALAAAAGGGPIIAPRSGITLMSVALVDSSGSILWYDIKANEGGYDLRKPESASSFVRNVFSNYPRKK
jgi:hypothetical protein